MTMRAVRMKNAFVEREQYAFFLTLALSCSCSVAVDTSCDLVLFARRSSKCANVTWHRRGRSQTVEFYYPMRRKGTMGAQTPYKGEIFSCDQTYRRITTERQTWRYISTGVYLRQLTIQEQDVAAGAENTDTRAVGETRCRIWLVLAWAMPLQATGSRPPPTLSEGA